MSRTSARHRVTAAGGAVTRRHRLAAAAGATALAIVGLAWTGTIVTAAVAAGTGSGPTEVYQCGQAVQRYYTGPHGEVTLVTANGRISFPDFGYLVAHLQQTGICRTTT